MYGYAVLPVDFDRDRHLRWLRGEIAVKRFKPSKPIDFGAMAVHGILNHELEGMVASSNAIEFVAEFAKEHGAEYVVGHNVDFDCDAIGSKRAKRICTLAMSRVAYPNASSHRLGAMMFEIEGETQETLALVRASHGAAADVERTFLLLDNLARPFSTKSMAELFLASERCRIPVVMSVGKHKGERITSLPLGYLDWFLDQKDVDPYLRKAMEPVQVEKRNGQHRRSRNNSRTYQRQHRDSHAHESPARARDPTL